MKPNLHKSIALAATFCGITACSSVPKEVELTRPADSSASGSILFVADPQVHNIYGRGLKQMLGISDVMSKVAVRQPELNILAPLVLEALIEKSTNTSNPQALVVLGDITNVACSGEYDTYLESITVHANNSVPLIMAHGNHDSYLMGTVNHYFPVDSQREWKPERMESSPVPTDESWWGESNISSKHWRNWRGGCYQPTSVGDTSESSPMNKSRWLAKYIQLLENHGAQITSTPQSTSDSSATHYLLELSANTSRSLQSSNFHAKGLWYPPKFGEVPTESYFTGTYDSFIVQSLDLGKTRIVVIDTSVCEKAQGGWKFIFNNAGQNACIGTEQLTIIQEFVAGTPAGSRLVLAGHFPLKDLSRSERRKLIKIASNREAWTYMSAHSHYATSALDWTSGLEVNVGSTTDWPMESNLVWFRESSAQPEVHTIRINQAPVTFSEASINEASEVCRHLPAAEKLANLNTSTFQSNWISPPATSECSVSNSSSWQAYGAKLQNAVSRIKTRFRNEPKYKNIMLSIAAAASKAEHDSFDFVELIP